MEWVETTGRTVSEALEVALDQLGVDEHDAEIVVLEEPKSALFGLRRSEARVRARVRPTRPRPKRQQRDRRGRTRNGREGGRNGKQPVRNGTDEGATNGEGDLVEVGVPVRSSSLGETDSDGQGQGSGSAQAARRNRTRRGGRSRSGGADGAQSDDGSNDGSGGNRPSGNGEDQVTVEEQAQMAHAFVSGVVERLGLAATTSVAIAEETMVEVSVDGEGLGLLIGPHGATLRALQELTRTATQRRSTEHGTRVVVDVAGYRAKRAAALAQFARSIAQQVIDTGTPHSLEPMSASDRKIVHDTVNDLEGVRTASEGEESARHVVIYPVTSGGRGEATAAESSADESLAAAEAPVDDELTDEPAEDHVG